MRFYGIGWREASGLPFTVIRRLHYMIPSIAAGEDRRALRVGNLSLTPESFQEYDKALAACEAAAAGAEPDGQRPVGQPVGDYRPLPKGIVLTTDEFRELVEA